MVFEGAEYLPLVGKTLSTAEKTTLQCSIPLLSSHYHCPATFWGKVTGYRGDYLIAQVSPNGFFGPRVSFFSINGGATWTLLEDVEERQAKFCEQIRGVYQGNPDYAYKIRHDIPPESEPEVEIPPLDDDLNQAKDALESAAKQAASEDGGETDEEDEMEEEEGDEEEEREPTPPRRRVNKPKFMIVAIKESTRLAHFIQLHDAACRLVVRGEYVLRGDAVGERNQNFSGHHLLHALKPSCYLKAHARGCPERNAVLYGSTYNAHTDYLLPITEDMPQGVWTVKHDTTMNLVVVENLFFDGSLFWYKPGTLERGQVYYGSGERNFELCLQF
ncbi:unnamed protein product [Phytomonas sp. EM1]|nr:unnamed protein product [Phytomonas sp. EM1]|eukprot:CCW65390.1 unnamed protein product [Phytomonas sp. isolate EM1]